MEEKTIEEEKQSEKVDGDGILVAAKTQRGIKITAIGLIILSIINVAAMIQVGYMYRQHSKTAYETTDDVIKEIKSIYDSKYIKGTYSTADAYNGTVKGFVVGIGDKYGSYLTPEEAKRFKDGENNTLTGIGVELNFKTEDNKTKAEVQNVIDNSPAKEVGIIKGDIIKSVDNNDVSSMDFNDIMNSIRGESGTTVSITVDRNGTQKSFEIARKEVNLVDVNYKTISGHIGYLQLKGFNRNTYKSFTEAIKSLQAQKVDSYIFDLRGNGGGLLDTAIKIIDTIVPKGLIARVEDNKGNSVLYDSDANELNGKMVVLVNNNTASAAELFTLTLRDYGKAKIVGDKTYGKGTTLAANTLSNGGMLILSSGLYYTKSSPNIEGTGIKPDYEAKAATDGTDPQLDKAIELLK